MIKLSAQMEFLLNFIYIKLKLHISPDDEKIQKIILLSDLKFVLQKIFSYRIWNGEFLSTWNEASIISIPKKK